MSMSVCLSVCPLAYLRNRKTEVVIQNQTGCFFVVVENAVYQQHIVYDLLITQKQQSNWRPYNRFSNAATVAFAHHQTVILTDGRGMREACVCLLLQLLLLLLLRNDDDDDDGFFRSLSFPAVSSCCAKPLKRA